MLLIVRIIPLIKCVLLSVYKGSTGTLTVKLARPIHMESVTIIHVSREQAVDLRSAPKDFLVFAAHEPTDSAYRYVRHLELDVTLVVYLLFAAVG